MPSVRRVVAGLGLFLCLAHSSGAFVVCWMNKSLLD